MKRILLLLVLLPAVAAAQVERPVEHLTGDPYYYYHHPINSLMLAASPFGVGNYNASGMPTVGVEYDRMVYKHLSVSAMGFYVKMDGRAATDTYTMREEFWFAGAKANYNQPLWRNRLYLRAGAGGGVGVHRPIDYTMGELADIPALAPPYKNRVAAHAIVDIWLAYRPVWWLDVRVSPLQLVFGSKFNAPYNDRAYFYRSHGTLGVGVRF
jgi:hypothetical protein